MLRGTAMLRAGPMLRSSDEALDPGAAGEIPYQDLAVERSARQRQGISRGEGNGLHGVMMPVERKKPLAIRELDDLQSLFPRNREEPRAAHGELVNLLVELQKLRLRRCLHVPAMNLACADGQR